MNEESIGTAGATKPDGALLAVAGALFVIGFALAFYGGSETENPVMAWAMSALGLSALGACLYAFWRAVTHK